MTKLAQDLTGVQHIVEALRANTHEFTNKLHVILGLLQLGETEKAEEYVQQITETRTQSIGYVADRIKDSSVAALLIGKAYRAAELGITFTLDPASALQGSGQFLPLSGLITVLGNLIENAFDALQGAPLMCPVRLLSASEKGLVGYCSV
ncbi:MAG: sensor histidine kinase [Evtepia sp.]